ncbi:hypothetical protein MRB53_039858 [Persea americana]|nr:hypothetical protein MRB53_039858 [Persea americana]
MKVYCHRRTKQDHTNGNHTLLRLTAHSSTKRLSARTIVSYGHKEIQSEHCYRFDLEGELVTQALLTSFAERQSQTRNEGSIRGQRSSGKESCRSESSRSRALVVLLSTKLTHSIFYKDHIMSSICHFQVE